MFSKGHDGPFGNWSTVLVADEDCRRCNRGQPATEVIDDSEIESLASGLEGKRVAVLGLAFKPETDDMRDAPSVEIIQGLLSRGAKVIAYDPVARDEAEKILPQIEYAVDEYEAANGADVLVFVTEWNQFRALNMDRIRTSMRAARVADLRNIYDPTDMREMGFEYVGVGR